MLSHPRPRHHQSHQRYHPRPYLHDNWGLKGVDPIHRHVRHHRYPNSTDWFLLLFHLHLGVHHYHRRYLRYLQFRHGQYPATLSHLMEINLYYYDDQDQ